MKVHWLALLIVVGAVLFAPPVSAKIIEEKDGYVISTVDEGRVFTSMARAFPAFTIMQGQTVYHSMYVPQGTLSFTPVLSWGSTSSSLTLTIAAPDLQFGPYYDISDGILDGRIGLRISRTGGLTAGTWNSAVYGQSVSGSQPYSYQAGLG